MSIWKLKLSVLVLFILVTDACTTPTNTGLPELTFKHLKPISLKVANIQISSMDDFNARPNDVSNRFPISPFEATKKWAIHRLQIAGNSGTAKFSILKAHVTETRLVTDKTFTGIFKQEASERYEAVVEAQIEILTNAVKRVLSTLPDNNNVLIGAGVGRFLVKIIARRMNITYIEFSELFECDNISRNGSNVCAPAIAIAQLNRLSKIK